MRPEEVHLYEPHLREVAGAATPEEREAASHRLADHFDDTGKPAHAEMIRLHMAPRMANDEYVRRHRGGGVGLGGPLHSSEAWKSLQSWGGVSSMDLVLPVGKAGHETVRYVADLPEDNAEMMVRALGQEGAKVIE